jgi:hypothetical protein
LLSGLGVGVRELEWSIEVTPSALLPDHLLACVDLTLRTP